MAIRKIHEVGDPCLTKVCRPVTEFNDRLHELLDDMADTLEAAWVWRRRRSACCAGCAS